MSIKGPFFKNFASAFTGAAVTGLLLKYGTETDCRSQRSCKRGFFTDKGRFVCIEGDQVRKSKLKK